MNVISLIFAGGSGTRMGNEKPKQFLEWNGKPILIQTIERFDNCDKVDTIVVISKKEWIKKTSDLIKEYNVKKVSLIVEGGRTALESQYNGLKKISELYGDDNIVLIHDGVRPLVSEQTIIKNIQSVKEHGSAITITNSIETVVEVDNNRISFVGKDRSKYKMAKAPQSFFVRDILHAHEISIKKGKRDYIDSASLMFDCGYELNIVEGEPENIKITTPSDYYMYLGIIKSCQNE